jgi:hypothetical protein
VNSAATHNRLAELRLVAFDIDGVFTDGRFYLSDDGIESKAFNTQDGFGIRRLIDAGFEVAVISGRRSAAVGKRMDELGVKHVILGTRDKGAAFDELISNLGVPISRCWKKSATRSPSPMPSGRSAISAITRQRRRAAMAPCARFAISSWRLGRRPRVECA